MELVAAIGRFEASLACARRVKVQRVFCFSVLLPDTAGVRAACLESPHLPANFTAEFVVDETKLGMRRYYVTKVDAARPVFWKEKAPRGPG